jgi:hypothetical protein
VHLVVFTPAGMERFFEQFASLPAPQPEAFARIGRPLGMEVLGPPLGATRSPLTRRSEPTPLLARAALASSAGYRKKIPLRSWPISANPLARAFARHWKSFSFADQTSVAVLRTYSPVKPTARFLTFTRSRS